MDAPTTAPSKPHKLIAPIDVTRVRNEGGVKALIKDLLNFHGWYTWMPAANGMGTLGVLDHLAIKDGVFLAIEAKFGANKPTPLQKAFAGQVIANSAFAFCVNEKNIDHLAWWLESFAISCAHEREGKEVPAEHGARMINAMSALTDLFA